jgi:glycosyltransferase involved in cell wall biosynthesis
MIDVHYYFRHPVNIYFSIEKIFRHVAEQLNQAETRKFNISSFYLPFPAGLANIWKNISYTHRTQSSINHITGDAHYAILGCSSKNINVLTVHDCVMLQKLKRTNPKFWIIKWLWYDLSVRKADMITVISENTKKDLIHFTGCPEDRIRIIPDFYDDRFRQSPRAFNRDKPNLLFIGTAENKNLDRLIEAIKGMSVHLQIIGKPSQLQLQRLEQNSISFRVRSGLSEEEMRGAYAESDILAFASVYEGFGLPILEAQLTGRPVLTSNLSPMKEVAGEGAVLVDPYDPSSIRKGLLRIIEDEELREKLIKSGFENVKRFDPATVANQYSSLYEELMTKKPIIAS